MTPFSTKFTPSLLLGDAAYEPTDCRVEIKLEKRLVWINDESAEAGRVGDALSKLPLLRTNGSCFSSLVTSQPS